jgi:uncharacterized membrane protein
MRRLALLLLTVAVFLLPALARADDVWVWTDAEGEAHYTNDPASIPERFRKSARAMGGEKSGGPEVTVVSKGEPKEKDKGAEPMVAPLPPPPDPIETAIRPPRDEEKASEQEWRSLFRKANDRVRRAERQIQRTRDALSKMPGSDFTSYDYAGNVVVESRSQALKLQLEEDQRNLDDSREQLHDLERAAARDAIPLEWRR